jgi:hypothetical protein
VPGVLVAVLVVWVSVAGCLAPERHKPGDGLGLGVINGSDRLIKVYYIGWRHTAGGYPDVLPPGGKTAANWGCRDSDLATPPREAIADWMHVQARFEDERLADERNWTVPECPEAYHVIIQPDYTMRFQYA